MNKAVKKPAPLPAAVPSDSHEVRGASSPGEVDATSMTISVGEGIDAETSPVYDLYEDSCARAKRVLDGHRAVLAREVVGASTVGDQVASLVTDLYLYAHSTGSDVGSLQATVHEAFDRALRERNTAPECAAMFKVLVETSGEASAHETLRLLEARGGYLTVLRDAKAANDLEDVLDSVIQSRVVDVRNGLRALGWCHKEGASLYSTLYKDGMRFGMDAIEAPSGHNVIGASYWISEGNSRVAFRFDALVLQAKDMAELLDRTAARNTGR